MQSTFREYFESLVVTVVLALFGTTFVVQAFKIPTPSMEDNLLVGDHLLVNKFVYGNPDSWLANLLPFREIRRGDVIVFRYPEDLSKHYVKRAIGLPGDRIRIMSQQVYLNGKPIDEPYVFHKETNHTDEPIRDDFPILKNRLDRYADYHRNKVLFDSYIYFKDFLEGAEVVVPADSYFAMGDNRDNSADSRYWGFVPRKNIVGRAFLIYWSFETDSTEHMRDSFETDSTEHMRDSYLDRVEQFGDVVINFFTKTRWNRTFKLVG